MLRCYTPLISFLITLLFLPAAFPLGAQENQKQKSDWYDWNFRISPYFWFIGFKGELNRPPVPSNLPFLPSYEIDVGFQDIRNSIKFAIMLAGQYKAGRFVTQFNFASLILESEAITPWELILQDNIINLTYFSGDFGVGYRIIKNRKVELDVLGGMKFVYFKIGLSTKLVGEIEIEGERSHLWYDPVVGMNFRYRPHRKVEFAAYGDLGATLLNTDFSYQYIAAANYFFTKGFFLTLGYRLYYVKMPLDEAIFNGHVKGPLARLGFQF